MIGFLYPVALLVAPGTAVLAGLRVGAKGHTGWIKISICRRSIPSRDLGLQLGHAQLLMDEMTLHTLRRIARFLRASVKAVRPSCSIQRVVAKQLEGQQSGFTSFPRLA